MSGSNYGVSYAKLSYYGVIPASTGYELYHHGRKGQKWGKRNGPPYPLTREKVSFAYGAKKVAKAIGRGASTTVKSIGRGAKAAGRGVRKAAIRFNLMPRKLMSEKELVDRMKRIQKENDLAHLQGKLTKLDRLEIDNENRRRRKQMISDAVGKTLAAIGTQALPGIIKDAVSKRKGYGDYEESKVAEREAKAAYQTATAKEKDQSRLEKEKAAKDAETKAAEEKQKEGAKRAAEGFKAYHEKQVKGHEEVRKGQAEAEARQKTRDEEELRNLAEGARRAAEGWRQNRAKISEETKARNEAQQEGARRAAEGWRQNRAKISEETAARAEAREAQEKHDKRSKASKEAWAFKKFKEAAENRYEDRGAKNVTVSGNTISYTNAYGERVTHDLKKIFNKYIKK